jgi:hypothetical protein
MKQPTNDEIIVCYGNAKPGDIHLVSTIHCIDEEILDWLERHEEEKRNEFVSRRM